ncbi:MAG: hypothetical protein CR971_00480 [candidate division SR1 bacterium]|nr:MAG: hypothetical protein CR971_00480 [candidate division SR1 bacterium]
MERIGIDIDSILDLVEDNPNISDLHLSGGNFIAYRLNGDIVIEEKAGRLSNETLELFLKQLFHGNPQRFNKFLGDKEADFAYMSKHGTPYRVNAFFKTGKIGLVMRKIAKKSKKLDELMFKHISDSIKNNVLNKDQGLFIISGPTGSGKTTSIISMLEEINTHQTKNIISIEDPIEFIFNQNKCLISQREVGNDTWSFKNALKSAMREDPDIVFVGEIRDAETAEAVLNLAETGHLVFTTLHTSSASHTISRFMSFFASDIQNGIAERLAHSLLGVMAQSLVKHAKGHTRVGVFELMLNTTSIKNNIKKFELDQLDIILQNPGTQNMISSKNYAQALLDSGIVKEENVERFLQTKGVVSNVE